MFARAVSARESLAPLAVLVPIGAAPVLGLWALSRHPAFTVVPLAGVLGLLVVFLLYAAVPGTAGVCET